MNKNINEQSEIRGNIAIDSSETLKKKHILKEYAESIVIAVILALLIRTFVVQAFKIPSASMEDTMLIGDRLLVNKFIYGLKTPFTDKRIFKIRNPERGDVIVFEYPVDPGKDFIKRVIGTPGDVVQIINKRVYINGRLYINPHEVHKESEIIPEAQNPRDNTPMIRVPSNSYFVMGDNRDRSYDSRFWGVVANDKIEGLAFIKFWSWDSDHHKVRWNRVGRWIE